MSGGQCSHKARYDQSYDRLEWPFLFEVLARLGKKKDGSVMFVQCLLTAGFQCSIMAVCMAKSSRGLRQGDPLAPSLFIIAEEVFSRGLLALYAAGAVKLHVPRGGPATSSHILFADDTIIFTNGSKRSLKRLMESTSGQLS